MLSMAVWGELDLPPGARQRIIEQCARVWQAIKPGRIEVIWHRGAVSSLARAAVQNGWDLTAHTPDTDLAAGWSSREYRTYSATLRRATHVYRYPTCDGVHWEVAAAQNMADHTDVALVYWSGLPLGFVWDSLWAWSKTSKPVLLLTPQNHLQRYTGSGLRRLLGPATAVGLIHGFEGAWAPLSCDWPIKITWLGQEWASVEHAYQVTRCMDPDQALYIQQSWTAVEARRRGNQETARPGWEDMQLGVMTALQLAKFSDLGLAAMLHHTAPSQLICTTDPYWGLSNGQGTNYLGQILTAIRDGQPYPAEPYTPGQTLLAR